MQIKSIVGALLLTSRLCSFGCGVTDAGKDEVSESSTTQADTIVWCSDKDWQVNFYSEPELLNVVGFYRCSCWQPEIRSGLISNYTSLVYEFTCSLD